MNPSVWGLHTASPPAYSERHRMPLSTPLRHHLAAALRRPGQGALDGHEALRKIDDLYEDLYLAGVCPRAAVIAALVGAGCSGDVAVRIGNGELVPLEVLREQLRPTRKEVAA